MNQILNDIETEVNRAMELYESFHSLHEGYAVLLEEVDELWHHVKTRQGGRIPGAIEKECIQIAAMAVRIICDCGKQDYQK